MHERLRGSYSLIRGADFRRYRQDMKRTRCPGNMLNRCRNGLGEEKDGLARIVWMRDLMNSR